MSTKRFVLALAPLLCATTASAVPINATLNKPATLSGTFGVLRPLSGWAPNPVDPAGSIDDGIFRPEGTVWNLGAIWWDATVAGSENNSITIDLQGSYSISGLITQADNNDFYRVDYFSPLSHSWINLGSWGSVCCFGLTTRPNSDQLTQLMLAPFTASAFRLSAHGGDGFYSLSEFQAYGEAVPEPSTILLLGAGLVAARRRFHARRQ